MIAIAIVEDDQQEQKRLQQYLMRYAMENQQTFSFALYSNALDNAMEAVCKLDDVEKRIIFVSVKEELGMAIIHVENNYTGELIMADGIPRTSKGDEFYHGYGVKSICMVVEKYDGNMALLPQNGIFNLNITIPVPEE